jgi:hypothetical protein
MVSVYLLAWFLALIAGVIALGSTCNGIPHASGFIATNEALIQSDIMDRKRIDDNDTAVGLATVTCEEDCIIYSWNFSSLRDFFSYEPKLGNQIPTNRFTLTDEFNVKGLYLSDVFRRIYRPD